MNRGNSDTENAETRRRVLLAMDDLSEAYDVKTELAAEGAVVIGPVTTIQDLLDLILYDRNLDAAVLAISLDGESTFVAADRLTERGVSLSFVIGRNPLSIPDRFKMVPFYSRVPI